MQRRTWWAAIMVACVVVMATGCQWVLPAYSPSGTRHNTAEQDIGVAEVPTLTADWTAALGSPFGSRSIPVVKSNVIVTATDGRLVAFAADGSRGCTTAALPTSAPIWSTAPDLGLGQPIIDGDRVFVPTEGGALHVYDLQGVQGCSGAPVTCAGIGVVPEILGDSLVRGGLTAADGRIYVFGTSIRSFDPAALVACAAASQPCLPLWESETRWDESDFGTAVNVAISGGRLYALTSLPVMDAPDQVDVRAFDLAGCEAAGSCWHVWATPTEWSAAARSIAVAGGMVVVSFDTYSNWDEENPFTIPGRVSAYSAVGCAAAAAETCTPTWTAPIGASGHLAIADGVVFVPDHVGATTAKLSAFDLQGSTGCSGSPTVCEPIRTMVDPANALQGRSPVVADGVVHLGPDAWAANGSTGCSGTPVVCTPLRSGGTPAEVIVVNGRVHLQQTPTSAFAKLVTQTPS